MFTVGHNKWGLIVSVSQSNTNRIVLPLSYLNPLISDQSLWQHSAFSHLNYGYYYSRSSSFLGSVHKIFPVNVWELLSELFRLLQ